MAVAGAGAENMDKGGAGAENKQFRLRTTANKYKMFGGYSFIILKKRRQNIKIWLDVGYEKVEKKVRIRNFLTSPKTQRVARKTKG